MKTRSAIITIIGSALALLALFAALPAGADHTIPLSNSTCGYNGASIADFEYQGEFQGEWILSWDRVPHALSVVMQAKGGGILNVWTTVNPVRLWDSVLGKSNFEMTALAQVAGQTMNFRVAVNCQGHTLLQGDFDHNPSAETSKD